LDGHCVKYEKRKLYSSSCSRSKKLTLKFGFGGHRGSTSPALLENLPLQTGFLDQHVSAYCYVVECRIYDDPTELFSGVRECVCWMVERTDEASKVKICERKASLAKDSYRSLVETVNTVKRRVVK
jgi:hypothetical protein